MLNRFVNLVADTLNYDFFHTGGPADYAYSFDSKTLPYASLAQSVTGRYQVHYGKDVVIETENGGAFLTRPHEHVEICHMPDIDGGRMRARWAFFYYTILGSIDLLSFFHTPQLITPAQAERLMQYWPGLSAPSDGTVSFAVKRKALAYQFLDELLRLSTIDQRAVDTVENYGVLVNTLQYISEHLSQKITISELAKECGFSVSHFHLTFKKTLGVSPSKYINDKRLSVACQRLITGQQPIASVAQSVGFDDQFYFAKAFKARYGLSPSSYRKIHSITLQP